MIRLAIMKRIMILIICLPIYVIGQQSKGLNERPINVPIGKISKNNSVIINNVPSYTWHRGCGPTALGMIIGYYDLHGFDELFPDSTLIQTNDINMLIASDEHYYNYSLPLDYYPNLLQDISEIGTPHINNSIADFMNTSMSSCGNYWGWSWSSDIGTAFESYVNYRSINYITSIDYEYYSNNSWNEYKIEIDNNRPVIILVDTDGDNSTDHFVVGIGYNEFSQEFGCYDTWDQNIHWYSWQEMDQGINWGVYGFNKFNIEQVFTNIEEQINTTDIHMIFNILGKQVNKKKNIPLLYIYNNGKTEKKIIID
tara:strand:+ start:1923 stop:2855 length:933 start_codon:yes stop_codon:yes gene_type:complete